MPKARPPKLNLKSLASYTYSLHADSCSANLGIFCQIKKTKQRSSGISHMHAI